MQRIAGALFQAQAKQTARRQKSFDTYGTLCTCNSVLFIYR